jgi:hypothetical protein
MRDAGSEQWQEQRHLFAPRELKRRLAVGVLDARITFTVQEQAHHGQGVVPLAATMASVQTSDVQQGAQRRRRRPSAQAG